MAAASPLIPANDGLRGICEAIWKVETELDLFEQEVAGVRVWRLIRWEVCRAFAQRANLALGAPGSAARPLAYRIGHEIGALRQSLQFPDWRKAGAVDTIVVPFPRKHLRGGAPTDIHSEPVLADPVFGQILALERTEADAQVRSRPNVLVADRDRGRPEAVARAALTFAAYLGPLRPFHDALDAATRRELGMAFPISLHSLALRVALFREYRAVCRRMLRATRTRRVIAVWHDQVMFAAAKDLGLETVEIQHAAYSRYNLHYHFPYRGEISYFADHFLTFGRFWIDSIDLPANTRPAVAGSSNMAVLRAQPYAKQSRRVVIPSQGPTYWPLLDAILEAAALAPDWEFVFRPHPREDFSCYETRIAARGGAPANLRLSERTEDVYGLIGSADVQIGIASTTLFEGMNLGCRTIVFQAPGCEAMEAVVASGDAALAATAADIVASLPTAPRPHDVDRYYAAPSSISQLLGVGPAR